MGRSGFGLEKEPPRSIFTWDELVSKFINQFFSPSKTTNLRNEITNFRQRFDESFSEAWGRSKDLLSATSWFLDKMPRDCLAIIESKSKVRYSRDKAIVAKVSTSSSTPGVSPDVVELKDMGSGSIPSNTVANPRGDMKAITTRSGVSYDGPQVPPLPSSLTKAVEHELEMDKCFALDRSRLQAYLCLFPYGKANLSDLTKDRMILVYLPIEVSTPTGIVEDVFVKVGTFLFLADFVVVDYIADPRTFSYNTIESVNRVDVIDVACEEFAQEVLGFSNISKSGNPTPTLEPILSTSPTSLTPFEGKQKFKELKAVEPSSDELPDLELKDLPPHLEYAFLEGTDKLPVIIAKDLKDEDKTALLKVLRSHKRAIAWKMSDIKGIDPKFCTHKILMEDNVKPTVQHQRRVNPKIHEVIKKEVIKLLEAGLIYPISDSPWVSPIHCVPKKGGITVIENDDNELIPTRLITGWRVCIDYRKLNDATRKDHFPLPFMDQMLERLAGNEYYCFLDGFSGYFQIPIDPKDQEKTTFTCPYETFAYRRMPFGLCNAPGTFQRCMMAIFHDMIEETMEVFMDDFSVFGDSFSSCLSYLDKMLKRCEDTNLVLN
ncbi:reverse transcriptase domain-containing protein [Tanacetum coccineum]